MPILHRETDCHPVDLVDRPIAQQGPWWLLYTKPRQEKLLMRHLRSLDIAHFGPQIEQRRRSPAGRIRKSYIPLFSNYVFMCGGDESRYQAVCTGCVQKATQVVDVDKFVADLLQVRNLIRLGVPLSVEGRLAAGERVRVRSGSFAGYEGIVVRREQETRLVVSVRFMQQGVSVKLEDCQLESIS